jgi:hypothetical protein
VEGQPNVPNVLRRPGASWVSWPSTNGWLGSVVLGWAAAFAILIPMGRAEGRVVDAAVLVPLAAGLVFMFLTRVELQDGQLCVSTRGIRRRCIYLYGLRSVTTRRSRWSIAPILVLVALDGTRLDLQLGSWRREEELLDLIYAAADRAQVKIDPRDAYILTDPPALRPVGRYGRESWLGGIPGGDQLTRYDLLRLGIAVAVWVVVTFGVSRVVDGAMNLLRAIWETVQIFLFM